MTKLISDKISANGKIHLNGINDRTKSIVDKVFLSVEAKKLTTLVEKNPWHDNENVYTHVLTVFANTQTLMTFDFIEDEKLKGFYKNYFEAAPVGCTLSRKELLLVACSLHDLGKGVVRPKYDKLAPGKTYLITLEDGKTKSTGHEHASALLSKKLLKNSEMSSNDKNYIYYLVDNHDFYSKDYCEQNLTFNPEIDVQFLRQSNIYLVELLLHIIADEYGAKVTYKLRKYLLYEIVAKLCVI